MTLWDSKAPQTIAESYRQTKRYTEDIRKNTVGDRLAIINDDWSDILQSHLAQMFCPENFRNVRFSLDTSMNLAKKVVDDISTVYRTPPTRSFTIDGEPDERAAVVYSTIDVDGFLEKVNRYMNAVNDVLIQVAWDPVYNRPRLIILTGAHTEVVQSEDDPNKAAAVIIDLEYADTPHDTRKLKIYWDSEKHFLFDQEGRLMEPAEGNPDMVNPFGILPFVFVHGRALPGLFWNTTAGNDLFEATILVGLRKTLTGYLFKTQSFKQLWTRGEISAPEGLILDPLSILSMTGADAEIGVLDLQARLDDLNKDIEATANGALATYGLSTDMFALSPREASGKALEIRNRALADLRGKQVKVFRKAEQDLFNLIRLVHNRYMPSKPINARTTLKIDFAEPEVVPRDEKETLDLLERKLKLGLISPAELYMAFNPDVRDVEEAVEKMRDNVREARELSWFGLDEILNDGLDENGQRKEER